MTVRVSGTTSRRRGFSLVELLVVIAIVVLLIGIVLPALGGARASGRKAVCLSNMRQWATATMVYTSEHRDYLPKPQHEVGTSAKDDPNPGMWFNALPVLAGAPQYTDIYDGTKTGQFPNANIWWCPEARAKYGPPTFTASGNAFDYAFNTVLDGSTSYGPKPLTGQAHISLLKVPAPSKTLAMSEPLSRFEYLTIMAGSQGLAEDRHPRDTVNMAFLDGHAALIEAGPGRAVYSGPGENIDTPLWTTHQGEVVWGSFY